VDRGGSKEWALRRRWNVCDDEQARMPEGSEFQTEGAEMLKVRSNVVDSALKILYFLFFIDCHINTASNYNT